MAVAATPAVTRRRPVAAPALLATLASCAGAPRPAPERAPLVAEVVAPGVVSTGNVYRGSFTTDGRTLYFFRKTGPTASEDYRIFRSTRTRDGWSTPEHVRLGDDASDLYPAVAPDGRTLVFSSYRRAPGDTSAHPNAHLWVATRSGDGWSAPRLLAGVSRLGWYHSQTFFARDGSLYVKRIAPDWRSDEVVVAPFDGRTFATPRPYEALVALRARRPDLIVSDAFPAHDDSTVILEAATRDAATGLPGSSDLWFAVRRGGGWSDPRPLGAGVNSPGTDNFPFFAPDGATLYFVRDFAELRRVDLRAAMR